MDKNKAPQESSLPSIIFVLGVFAIIGCLIMTGVIGESYRQPPEPDFEHTYTFVTKDFEKQLTLANYKHIVDETIVAWDLNENEMLELDWNGTIAYRGTTKDEREMVKQPETTFHVNLPNDSELDLVSNQYETTEHLYKIISGNRIYIAPKRSIVKDPTALN